MRFLAAYEPQLRSVFRTASWPRLLFWLHGLQKFFGLFGGIGGKAVPVSSMLGAAGAIETFGGALIIRRGCLRGRWRFFCRGRWRSGIFGRISLAGFGRLAMAGSWRFFIASSFCGCRVLVRRRSLEFGRVVEAWGRLSQSAAKLEACPTTTKMTYRLDCFAGIAPAGVQTDEASGDWPMFNRDLAGTRYSPLTQVTPANVGKLAQVWSYRLQPATFRFATASGMSELTPLVVNGVMYISAQSRVMALEPETGKEIWRYEVQGASPRGVAFWPGDRQNPSRIVFTAGASLIALNAGTGKLDPGFGKEGTVDMVVPYNGVPTIFKNLVLAGASTGERETGPPGNTRHAYDARTGREALGSFRRCRGRVKSGMRPGSTMGGRIAPGRIRGPGI